MAKKAPAFKIEPVQPETFGAYIVAEFLCPLCFLPLAHDLAKRELVCAQSFCKGFLKRWEMPRADLIPVSVKLEPAGE